MSWSVMCFYGCIFTSGAGIGSIIIKPWWWSIICAVLFLICAFVLEYLEQESENRVRQERIDKLLREIDAHQD